MPIELWYWDNGRIMKKTLYIISKPPDEDMKALLSSPKIADHSISAILIQQGTSFFSNFPFPFFVLEKDISTSEIPDSYTKIQYSDMLQMIFDADTVISI